MGWVGEGLGGRGWRLGSGVGSVIGAGGSGHLSLGTEGCVLCAVGAGGKGFVVGYASEGAGVSGFGDWGRGGAGVAAVAGRKGVSRIPGSRLSGRGSGERAGASGGVWLSELWLPGRAVLRVAVVLRGCLSEAGAGLGYGGG